MPSFDIFENKIFFNVTSSGPRGVQGDKGDKGDTGDTGPQGIPGSTAPYVSKISAAGANLSGLRIVYELDNMLYYADSNDIIHKDAVVGIILNSVVTGANVEVIFSGAVSDPSWNWNSPAPLFLGTNGQIVENAPETGVLIKVGFSTSPTNIMIKIAEPITRL